MGGLSFGKARSTSIPIVTSTSMSSVRENPDSPRSVFRLLFTVSPPFSICRVPSFLTGPVCVQRLLGTLVSTRPAQERSESPTTFCGVAASLKNAIGVNRFIGGAVRIRWLVGFPAGRLVPGARVAERRCCKNRARGSCLLTSSHLYIHREGDFGLFSKNRFAALTRYASTR